jgi:hypothetical protein
VRAASGVVASTTGPGDVEPRAVERRHVLLVADAEAFLAVVAEARDGGDAVAGVSRSCSSTFSRL